MAQQQWASQQVYWDFSDSPIQEVSNIDQQVWLPQPNTSSFWPVEWNWMIGGQGGYIGMQQLSNGDQIVLFSIWDAIDCKNGTCTRFGGEGTGYQCILPFTIDTNKFYRYRLGQMETDGDGAWWEAWLIEEINGEQIDHHIGSIKVPSSCGGVNLASIRNFVEYWGDAMKCTDLPMSVVGFARPTVYNDAIISSYNNNSIKAGGNNCGGPNQEDGNGALITVKPYDFGFAEGVIVFLGGNNPNPEFSTPPPPPVSNG